MMNLTDQVYLRDILDCIERIELYCKDGREVFMNSILIQDAVIRNFEIIGEASKQLSCELKSATSHIPWRQMGDFRNLLIHDYAKVDMAEVWSVVENDLDSLKQVIKTLLNDLLY
ncbi:DUF86 domain-containing protein [Fodinisporobacter ferrooxydans]|uniref:DUF86 domain-containing protein n=1 Tax=Fodinisporobacter ferrooxydans TaxID=2901836 RepID=A0ABY4CLX8_9BACL|nr:DUF86 domain-containing protein [Alicyclobacillaceae bacterium MYW30-H2]